MTEETYFVIHCSEDGDVSVNHYTKDELLEALEGEDYGADIGFHDSLERHDPQYWGRKILIIKGSIVVPKPKKVIESYDI